mgnify:CR=1 FL=1
MGLKYKVRLKFIPNKVIKIHTNALCIIHPNVVAVNECIAWCKRVIGTNGWSHHGEYKKIPYQLEFKFEREEDLLAFKLIFGKHCMLDTE